MRLFANEILLGRYRLESLLGEGGMGMVWRARDHQEDRDVAIKFVKDAAGPDEHRRFLREARAAMAVDHPAIVRVFSVETAPDGTPMMIMELLRGETLAEMIERVGRLTLAQCADIFLPIVSAVGTAHAKGVIHRDLKPENVFLVEVPKGKPPEVRVLDFGIAKLTALEGDAKATAGLTSTGTLLGTPYYMSPEQVFADKDLDHRADIWSLGVVLYECLSGRKPVQGDSLGQLLRVITTASMPPLRALSPELPEDVLALNERMLRVDRNDRPSDLREVYTVFRAYTSAQASPFSGATLRISGLPEHGIGTGPVAAVAPALTPAPGQMPSDSGARSGSISASTPMPSGVPSGRPGWLLPAALVAGLVVAGGGFGLRSAMTAPAAGTAPAASTLPPMQPPSASSPVASEAASALADGAAPSAAPSASAVVLAPSSKPPPTGRVRVGGDPRVGSAASASASAPVATPPPPPSTSRGGPPLVGSSNPY